MKKFTTMKLIMLTAGFVIAVSLNGCGTTSSIDKAVEPEQGEPAAAIAEPAPAEDQEGGITGTGHSVDCAKTQNKQRQECMDNP